MQLTIDVQLEGPIWQRAVDELVGKFFKTNWDLYALSISIGMMYDKQIPSKDMIPDGYEMEPKYIPRNMLGHAQNASLLDFMFQSALLTTKNLDYSEDQRLELAFNQGTQPDFNPLHFLTSFANYGVTEVAKLISEDGDLETMESLMTFLNELYEKGASVVDSSDPDPQLD